jgi:hypothetical protein
VAAVEAADEKLRAFDAQAAGDVESCRETIRAAAQANEQLLVARNLRPVALRSLDAARSRAGEAEAASVAAGRAVIDALRLHGVTGLKVATIVGDDIRPHAADLDLPEDKVAEILRFAADTLSLSTPLSEDGDAELGEDGLSLMFVYVHEVAERVGLRARPIGEWNGL